MVQRKKKGRGRSGRRVPAGGVSLVTIDPGSSTGVAWAVIPYKVLIKGSWAAVEWAVASMRERGPDAGFFHTQTFHAEDYIGRGLSRLGDPLGENGLVSDVIVWIRKYANQAGRVTGQRVSAHQSIIIEDFILRRETATGRRDLLAPVRIQSKLEYQLWLVWSRSGLVDVQSPSQKTVATDARLKKHGLWKGFGPHERDCIRHMIVYLREIEVPTGKGA